MRASFFTLGCKVNQYETQILKQMFSAEGYDIVEFGEQAEVCVVNSCTVTDTGDKKTRQALRRAKRENPGAVVALCGCMPQAFPNLCDELPEAQVITGSYNRKGLLDAVKLSLATGERVIDITPHQRGEGFERMRAKAFDEHTRAFVKIEDGCERYCSYCIIPTARGPVRSKPIEELQTELRELAAQGFKEAVLVGINLSCYGKDLGLRLLDAVKAAAAIPGIERIRLGSLEPELLTYEDIKALASLPQFCPQFHLSLQSGCDETLKRMNRHYTAAEYMKIVKMIRSVFKNSAITTDIMVGFPGETDAEFEASLAFFKSVGFAKAHVFAYSPRAGTKAALLNEQVKKSIKEQRSHRMLTAAEQAREQFLWSQTGIIVPVLFETSENGLNSGYTMNYTPVHVACSENLQGTIRQVRLTGAAEDACVGQLV
ncbi:tRNA (N(6)-L-threonylcarbamoyladenosine(37)-C(2))-methylthiotransferase MtaB [Acetanaerobacterium elongatum]|uniref:Threonylcarbamoyladenosine tRNA methylthiotransferase MtaB n=1 Tax=Acetanaerobacterium elongatum TaxID=258515 RepID=A0A1G9WYT9_9FIRM|nr:tRNA (N(6)-L-threonylcarbamoyladenosine(37)-C(2))-methylthiotransferase MtaB [Acetanaerobacterium elongatum]SDM89702.1 threonylcarbamoyladenosine tRNA methylthiotransferase MtaB [Acetanaerobacterium elongatum]